MSRLCIALAGFLFSFSAAASSHSCISLSYRYPDYAILLTPSGGNNWMARVYNRETEETYGNFPVKRLLQTSEMTIFGSMEFKVSMYKPQEYGHRKSEVEIKPLSIFSNRWLCKEIP